MMRPASPPTKHAYGRRSSRGSIPHITHEDKILAEQDARLNGGGA